MSTVDEQKLKKLKELLEMVNESLTREEFTKAFRTVLEFVLKIRDRNEEEMGQREAMHGEMMKRIEAGNSELVVSAIEEMKKKMMDMVEPMMKKMYTEHEEMMKRMNTHMSEMQSENVKVLKEQHEGMKFIYDKIRTMKSGKNADEEKIVGEVLKKLPEETPEQTRNKLESIKEEEEKLTISAIKDLRKELDEVKKAKSSGLGVGVIGRDLIKDIDISDSLDGVTKTFNIQAIWNVISVDLSSYPYGSLRKGIDFSWTPTSITFGDSIDATTQLSVGQQCILTVIQG